MQPSTRYTNRLGARVSLVAVSLAAVSLALCGLLGCQDNAPASNTVTKTSLQPIPTDTIVIDPIVIEAPPQPTTEPHAPSDAARPASVAQAKPAERNAGELEPEAGTSLVSTTR